MSDEPRDDASHDGEDGLVDRLDVIESQPLASRADAYAQLHEELRRALEGDDGHGRA
ncbi:hypothetical protein [Leifsonia sp. AG29]|uniref:hypothetical protein n=1 Tax=Leifsonia sp. AG29 TaxID=2598860 RepID=UPI0018EEEEDF|nr:hypothetical protein [Leifsonia sp. AG29]